MIKALIKKLYFKLFPDRADVSKEYVIDLEAELRAYKRWEASVDSKTYTKKTYQAECLIERSMYETYKHNPDYLKFVREDMTRLLFKAIEDKIEISTVFNTRFEPVRIIGRLDFWEEV